MNRLISWSHPLWLLVALVPACGGDGNGTDVSTSDLVATCKNVCNKEKSCLGAEASVLDCNQMCSPDNLQKNTSSTSKTTCDYAKLESKFDACLNVDCKDLESCVEDASSVCQETAASGTGGASSTGDDAGVSGEGTSPSGSGGAKTSSSGSGGAKTSSSGSDDAGISPSGAGGAGGGALPSGSSGAGTTSADCDVCDHANACCKALIGVVGTGDTSSCDTFSKSQCESTPEVARTEFVQVCSQTLAGGAAAGIAACK